MWILFAILGALSKSAANVLRKKLSRIDSSVYAFMSYSITTLVLIIIALLMGSESFASITNAPVAIALSGIIQIVAVYSIQYTFRGEDLSLVAPITALTPVYTVFVAMILIGEAPTLIGYVGILIIILGAIYATSSSELNLRKSLEKLLGRSSGRVAFLIPLAYAGSASFQKAAMNEGITPIVSVVCITAIVTISSAFAAIKKRDQIVAAIKDTGTARELGLVGIASVASVGFATLALNGAIAAYALSLRRLEVLFSVIIGWKYFKEGEVKRRLTGSTVMIIGVVLLAIS